MPDATNTPAVNWLDFEEPQQVHECDCQHCDFNGELEGERYRMLRTLRIHGVEYVTDRYLALRRDFAPIPPGYPGEIDARVLELKEPWSTLGGDFEPESETSFLWHIAKVVSERGWILCRSENDRQNRWVIRDADGSHIGWAMSTRQPQTDEREPGHTWSYSMIQSLAGASS